MNEDEEHTCAKRESNDEDKDAVSELAGAGVHMCPVYQPVCYYGDITPMHLPTWHKKDQDTRSFGARLADSVAGGMGSWTFIIVQTVFVIGWMLGNGYFLIFHFDKYPFILLNLLFSTQAAYAAPIIMMSQNRAAERDRHQAEADYQTNRDAKLEIEELQQRLARIENEKLDKIIALLQHK